MKRRLRENLDLVLAASGTDTGVMFLLGREESHVVFAGSPDLHRLTALLAVAARENPEVGKAIRAASLLGNFGVCDFCGQAGPHLCLELEDTISPSISNSTISDWQPEHTVAHPEFCRLALDGMSIRQIADMTGYSKTTVRTHLKRQGVQTLGQAAQNGEL